MNVTHPDTPTFSLARATTTVHERPFRVIVVDGAFDDRLLHRVLDEWPEPSDPRWHRFATTHEVGKRQGTDPAMRGPAPTAVFDVMLSAGFCAWVARQLDVGPVVGDTWGGGYHETHEGGFLARHADFVEHPERLDWRRANALLYLNEGWEPEWGGALEVGAPGDDLVIDPSFNRLVCFETASTHWHGHPSPWCGPTPRRSLATFYYQPAASMPPDLPRHSTLWYDEQAGRSAFA